MGLGFVQERLQQPQSAPFDEGRFADLISKKMDERLETFADTMTERTNAQTRKTTAQTYVQNLSGFSEKASEFEAWKKQQPIPGSDNANEDFWADNIEKGNTTGLKAMWDSFIATTVQSDATPEHNQTVEGQGNVTPITGAGDTPVAPVTAPAVDDPDAGIQPEVKYPADYEQQLFNKYMAREWGDPTTEQATEQYEKLHNEFQADMAKRQSG